MTKRNHPYPAHVLQKVAAEIRYSVPTLQAWEARALAESVLVTLWEASRVDSAEDLADIHDDALILTKKYGTQWGHIMKIMLTRPAHYPAHVLHWGNHD